MNKISVWLYVRTAYKYSDKETTAKDQALRYSGRSTGSGTCIQTGKRDISFLFPDRKKAKLFLANKLVKKITYGGYISEEDDS